MPKEWDFGVLGVKNLSVGICDGAQTTVCSSFHFLMVMETQKNEKHVYTSQRNMQVYIYKD